MTNLTYKLLACLALVCAITASGGHAATISPQQLLPQGAPDKIRTASDSDSSVTTLQPETPKSPGDTLVAPPQGAGSGETVIIVPPASTAPPSTVVIQPSGIGPSVTQPSAPTVILPTTPDKSQTTIMPAIPQTPSTVVSPTQPSTTVVIPDKTAPAQPQTPPAKIQPTVTPAPEKPKEQKPLTPADFLPKTPTKPEKDKKTEKVKPEPEKKPLKSAKGDSLRIPPDIAKTKDLSFLEGCWKGPETGTVGGKKTRIKMEAKFCFDKNGHGKRFLRDLSKNEECLGSAGAVINDDGTFRLDAGSAHCPSGTVWEPPGKHYMVCRDNGKYAECQWQPAGKTDPSGPYIKE